MMKALWDSEAIRGVSWNLDPVDPEFKSFKLLVARGPDTVCCDSEARPGSRPSKTRR